MIIEENTLTQPFNFRVFDFWVSASIENNGYFACVCSCLSNGLVVFILAFLGFCLVGIASYILSSL